MTDIVEKNCGTCAHHSGGTSPRCRVPLPYWAEPHTRGPVYKSEGHDCPLHDVDLDAPAEIERLRAELQERHRESLDRLSGASKAWAENEALRAERDSLQGELDALDRSHADLSRKLAKAGRDAQLGQNLEAIIAMRTGFTGEHPYVGNEGVALALTQALDERDRLRDTLKPFSDAEYEMRQNDRRHVPDDFEVLHEHGNGIVRLDRGHFRAARDALSETVAFLKNADEIGQHIQDHARNTENRND